MPLHDWTALSGWEGVHLLWIAELLRQVKGKLPAGFRAYLGSGPALAVGSPPVKPDLSVRTHEDAQVRSTSAPVTTPDPDVEVAVAELDQTPSLLVERSNRLVAALELISPRNKDRGVARSAYLNRYVGYLIEGVHLLLVDVHARPIAFSFADAIARELNIDGQPPLPPPSAVSYRVGEPAAQGGRMLAIWRRALLPGKPLPSLPLPLDTALSVEVDLEPSYVAAAQDAYLS